MKKVLSFLVLSFLFIQCSTNNEIEEEGQEERLEQLTVSVTIEGDLLNENREKILYLSSEEGVIEDQLSLQNNQENLLTVEREPDVNYHLIVHDILTYNGRTRHDFSIFQNIQSSDFTVKANPDETSGGLPDIDLHIFNTGNIDPLEMTGGGQSSWSSANGGTFTSTGNTLTDPGDYYASFKKQGEPFARYFWKENMEEDKIFTLDYEELPTALLVETELPEHVSATVFVHGYSLEHPSAGHSLSRGNTEGNQTFETYFPEEDVFDYIRFSSSFFNGTKSYSVSSISEAIPSNVQVPDFDLTINSFSVDDTNYSTTGNYDISNATFIISEDNLQVLAMVKVFSEQSSIVSFSIGTLINSLFGELPSLDAVELVPSTIMLSSYNYHENYEEAVKELIEGNNSRSLGSLNETVYRRNN